MYQRQCEFCKNNFDAKNITNKYCSKLCKDRNYRKIKQMFGFNPKIIGNQHIKYYIVDLPRGIDSSNLMIFTNDGLINEIDRRAFLYKNFIATYQASIQEFRYYVFSQLSEIQ